MSGNTPNRDSSEELAFFGKIGADVSHEMRNILAIVGENAGLLDDQLMLAERGRPLDSDRLKSLSARITRQVTRGTQAMQRFSRFAHAADEGATSSDLTAITETITSLAERHVVLAGCQLKAEIPEQTISVKANPFLLQHAIFSAIELILEMMDNDQVLSVQLSARGDYALVSVSGETDNADEMSGQIERLSVLIDELEGSIETTIIAGRIGLVLTIPCE